MTVLLTMAAGISSASAEPTASRSVSAEAGWIRVVNSNSGKCLAVPGGNAYPGAVVVQWTCNGGASQSWYTSGSAWSTLKYDNVHCLAIGGASTANGAKAILWPCNGGGEQLWYVGGATTSPIYNWNSDKALAIGGASKAEGAAAIQWTPNGGSEQKWWFYN